MVKILATLEGFFTKGYYLMQKLEPVIGGVHLPYCFYNKFSFHNLNCSRYEGFKNLDVLYATEKLCFVWDIYFLKPSHPLAQRLFKVSDIPTIVPCATNVSFTGNSKFT